MPPPGKYTVLSPPFTNLYRPMTIFYPGLLVLPPICL